MSSEFHLDVPCLTSVLNHCVWFVSQDSALVYFSPVFPWFASPTLASTIFVQILSADVGGQGAFLSLFAVLA